MTSTGPLFPYILKRTRISRSTQEDMLHACSFPEDLKSFEHAVQENISFIFGVIYRALISWLFFLTVKKKCDSELQDEVRHFSLSPSGISDVFYFKAYFILDNKLSTPPSPKIGWNSQYSHECVSLCYFRRHLSPDHLSPDALILFWSSDALILVCSNLADATRTGNMCFDYPACPFNSCKSIWFSLTVWRTCLPLTQGDKNELYPIEYAEQLLSQLTGVKDGAILYSVKGGSIPCLSYILSQSSYYI